MPACSALYWTKEVRAMRMNEIRFFSRTWLSTDLVKLRTLRCFFLCFGSLKFRGRNFYKEGRMYENERDKIFFKDMAKHRPCKTTDIKVFLLVFWIS